MIDTIGKPYSTIIKTVIMKKKYLTEEQIEREQFENELFSQRLSDQKSKRDYDYNEDGSIEKCDDCGSPINSNGHCPRCDY